MPAAGESCNGPYGCRWPGVQASPRRHVATYIAAVGVRPKPSVFQSTKELAAQRSQAPQCAQRKPRQRDAPRLCHSCSHQLGSASACGWWRSGLARGTLSNPRQVRCSGHARGATRRERRARKPTGCRTPGAVAAGSIVTRLVRGVLRGDLLPLPRPFLLLWGGQ